MMKRSGFLRTILIASAACLLYGVSSGIRSNYGIMLGAITASSGVDYASVSFVLAVAQHVVGLVQPLAGILALKKSNAFVLCAGAVLITAGLAGIPFCHSLPALLLFLGIFLAGGTGAIAFGIIMGAITPVLGERTAAMISGFVSASCGLGGTVLAPLMQVLMNAFGFRTMMLALCVPAVLLIPISLWLSRAGTAASKATKELSLSAMLKSAVIDRNFLRIALAFFTCGFYMAIIETHLFSQYTSYGFSKTLVAFAFSVYGAGAMLGCVLTGFLDTVLDPKWVLGCTYGLRVPIILALLLLPKSPAFVYGTALLFGLSGNATVPPTSGLLTKLFGAKKLAALFGIAFLAHQVGSFFSSWLGGVCAAATGSYAAVWYVSMAFSAAAAILCFGVRASGHQGEEAEKIY